MYMQEKPDVHGGQFRYTYRGKEISRACAASTYREYRHALRGESNLLKRLELQAHRSYMAEKGNKVIRDISAKRQG